MTITHSLYLDQVALVSPLGDTPAATFAAVRSSVSGFAEDLFLVTGYEKIKSATVPASSLPPLEASLLAQGLTSRQRRITRLCSLPLTTLAGDAGKLDGPLILVMPEMAPAASKYLSQAPNYLSQQTGVALFPSLNKVLPYGRAGVFQALAEAGQMLAQGQLSQVYIGAVDTFFDTRYLAQLAADRRVASRSANNAFIPGEAAVFFRVSRQPSATSIRLGEPGRALEAGHIYADQPCLGEGLDSAWKQALGALNGAPMTTLISSLNGELYWARELGVAAMRNSASFSDDYQHLHPADCLGDCGAAAGAIGLALAYQGLIEEHMSGPVLVYSSSDLAPRGAVLVAR